MNAAMYAPLPLPTAGLVRYATPADEEALVAMVREMHADPEWGWRDCVNDPFPFSPEKTRATVQRATQRNRNEDYADIDWIGVVGDSGQLVGSAYVCVQSLAVSEGVHLMEVWNWLYPAARHSSASDALIDFSIGLANELGLVLHLAAMTQARMAKSRFYERRFGHPVASLYRYSPNGAL